MLTTKANNMETDLELCQTTTSRGPAATLQDETLIQELLETYAQDAYSGGPMRDRWVECKAEVLKRLAHGRGE
jgi:hypothetical protein